MRDVPARLAEGRAAVSETAAYVSACYATGYRHPDLTAHSGQVEEWYAAEDGLDLTALDGDCVALRSAAEAADEALRMEQDGRAVLADEWLGESGSSADEFVERHLRAGRAVAAALRGAAEVCADLADTLWRLVDGKVGAALAIDDRCAGQRPGWLAAAHQVLSGDRSEAAQVVEQEIRPYVDDDIRGDWVAAMRSGTASVSAAYDEASAALTADPPARFEVPAHLGPVPARADSSPAARATVSDVPSPPPAPGAPASAGSAAADPTARVPPLPPPAPVSAGSAPPPAPPPALPPLDAMSAGPAPPTAGLPLSAAAPPGGGAWLPNLAGQLADMLAGPADVPPDPPDSDAGQREPPEPTGSADPAGEPEPDAEEVGGQKDSVDSDDAEEAQETSGGTGQETGQETEAQETGEGTAEPLPQPAVEPTDEVPATAPPPEEAPTADLSPCEIAADELPQIGQ